MEKRHRHTARWIPGAIGTLPPMRAFVHVPRLLFMKEKIAGIRPSSDTRYFAANPA